MTAYAITYGADPTDRFSATAHPDRAAARAASLRAPGVPDGHNGGGCGYVIERAEDVTLSGPILVAVYNAVTGAGLQRFESRAIGVQRLLAALDAIAPNQQQELVVEQLVNEQTAPVEKRQRQPRTNPVTEAARAGVMPPKPVVTSESNKHRQKHFDKLAEYAAAGEWDKVRAYNMAGIDSYCKMINLYRDQLLIAHDAS